MREPDMNSEPQRPKNRKGDKRREVIAHALSGALARNNPARVSVFTNEWKYV
jgi:hypothetical protein